MKNILRISIIILGLIGFVGVSKISYEHFHGNSCPMLGMIPACYVIFVGYAMIIISMIPKINRAGLIFIIGWTPVIVLALMGTVGEWTHTVQCPRTASGNPACYFSAGYSTLIGVLAYWFFKKARN